MLVYKITNLVNGKIYIGITEKTVEERFREHLGFARRGDKDYPLYKAIRKYGEENFLIEPIDETASTRDDLRKLEVYYISLYQSNDYKKGYNQTPGGETNGGEDNPRSRLTEKEVYEIREKYSERRLFIRDVYKFYKEKISFSAFEKIWEGFTWKTVHMDVYTEENKKYHREEGKRLKGSKNPFSKIDAQTLLEARKYFVNHTRFETFEKFGQNYYTPDGFRSALMGGYPEIPIYKKNLKQWFFNGEPIDINNFNPVSTILESEE